MQSTRQFCTLFDRNYVARALVLYRSLEEFCESFVLRALCMDEESRELVEALGLPCLRPIRLADVEAAEPALLAARANRSPKEYCWTCSSAICQYLLEREPDLQLLTYLDADLCFVGTPAPMFDQLDGGSILLVPDRQLDAGDAGIYNVGWITFRRDENGLSAVRWWRERCIEWCYDRVEPQRYGDQKYLDDWPQRFRGVVVAADPEPGIYYHHSGLRVHRATRTARFIARCSGVYRRTADVVWTVIATSPTEVPEDRWRAYVERLSGAHAQLGAVGAPADLGLSRMTLRVTASQIVRHRAPAWIKRLYLRVPVPTRNRISSWLSPA